MLRILRDTTAFKQQNARALTEILDLLYFSFAPTETVGLAYISTTQEITPAFKPRTKLVV